MSNLNSQTLKRYLVNNLLSKKLTMKFIPILFSTPMVQSILEGRKTQTRRVIKQKDQPHLKYDNSCIDYSNGFGWVVKHQIEEDPNRYEITQNFKCPYGKVGDILWVRETWIEAPELCTWKKYSYKADYNSHLAELGKWKPSIHMPKLACRLFLKVKSLRVERLQDISETDAESEGIGKQFSTLFNEWRFKDYYNVKDDWRSAVSSFQSLWASINGEQSWNDNPWVWVIEFERIELTTEQRNQFLNS